MAINWYLQKEKLMMKYSSWVADRCMNGLGLTYEEYCALLKKYVDGNERKDAPG